jgi:hypothetical protein
VCVCERGGKRGKRGKRQSQCRCWTGKIVHSFGSVVYVLRRTEEKRKAEKKEKRKAEEEERQQG